MSVVINSRFLTQSITGVQRFAIEISLRIKKLIPEAIFVAPPFIKHHSLAEALEVREVGLLNSHLWEQIELPRFLKMNKNPLLINFTNTAPLLYKPQIVTIHDLAFKVNPKWFSKSFVLLYDFLIPRIAKNSERIITVSQSSKNELIKVFDLDPNKISIVNNAVNILRIPDNVNNTNQLNLKKFILAVGSIDPRKNLGNLIKAFTLVKSSGYKLIIIGGKSNVFASSDLVNNLNEEIIYTGYLSDEELAFFYSHADLFIYPSLYEGFGIPPLEAMSYGCPTIVSNISSLKEVCGEASIFVNPNNIESIASAIDSVLGNVTTKNKLIAAGKKQIKKYNWEASAKRVFSLIKETEVSKAE